MYDYIYIYQVILSSKDQFHEKMKSTHIEIQKNFVKFSEFLMFHNLCFKKKNFHIEWKNNTSKL